TASVTPRCARHSGANGELLRCEPGCLAIEASAGALCEAGKKPPRHARRGRVLTPLRRVLHFHRCSVLLLLSAVLLVWDDLPLVQAATAATLTSGVDGELDAGGPANAGSDPSDSATET